MSIAGVGVKRGGGKANGRVSQLVLSDNEARLILAIRVLKRRAGSRPFRALVDSPRPGMYRVQAMGDFVVVNND